MTAQVVLSPMSTHPFPSAFSSPVATPSPAKEMQFASFPFPLHPPADASASTEAGPSHSQADLPKAAATNGEATRSTEKATVRTVRAPDSRRMSRPRLSSLQSLNSAPASPSLTEQDSGRAFISASRFHTSHPSLGRAPSRNAVESLQPLAESSASTSRAKAHTISNAVVNTLTRSPTSTSQQWNANNTETRPRLPGARRSSTSPKLDSGLSEFGQMGAPFTRDRDGEGGDVSTKLRNFHNSSFLRRSHTITSGVSSFAPRRTEDTQAFTHRSPPSNAMTCGPSSGGRNASKLAQRRQTVSNVSPDSLARPAGTSTSSVSPAPSRTLSYKQPFPHPAPGISGTSGGSNLSVSPAPSHLRPPRERGTLPNNQLEAKVVILGSQGVGKTSLVHRYTSGHFALASTPSTIGASFHTKKLIVDGVKVRLQLWDTAGQERFRSMAPMYYRGSHAAVIVYDITSMSSFLDCRAWIEELKKNMTTDLVIHVVGAKADLGWSKREVELEFARSTLKSWLQPYVTQPAFPSTLVNDLGGSPGSPTRPGSRLSGLGSLAMGSASRFASFQRSSSTPNGLKPSSLGSSNASSGSGSDAGRDLAPDLGDGFSLSWDLVEVSEVSAKNDRGIEEVFLAVTKKLVERRSQIEQERQDRERNSIFLSERDVDGVMGANGEGGKIEVSGWTCCG